MNQESLNQKERSLNSSLFNKEAVQNLRSEIVSDNQGKKGIKISNLSKEQKELIVSLGIAGAGFATGASAFSLFTIINPEVENNNEQDVPNSSSDANTESVVIFPDAPFADQVNNEMSFNEAFETARNQVGGGGGVFEWNGNIYNTYLKEEWENMSASERTEYFQSIDQEIIDATDLVKLELSETPVQQEVIPEIPTPQIESVQELAVESESNQSPIIDGNETLDFQPVILQGIDLTGDMVSDIFIVDANSNDIPDLMIDSNLDGTLDQLVLDVDISNPNFNVANHENYEINVSASELQEATEVPVMSVQGEVPLEIAQLEDVDTFSESDLNPNFDNDVNMEEYL